MGAGGGCGTVQAETTRADHHGCPCLGSTAPCRRASKTASGSNTNDVPPAAVLHCAALRSLGENCSRHVVNWTENKDHNDRVSTIYASGVRAMSGRAIKQLAAAASLLVASGCCQGRSLTIHIAWGSPRPQCVAEDCDSCCQPAHSEANAPQQLDAAPEPEPPTDEQTPRRPPRREVIMPDEDGTVVP
jgi:hypothetical protein